jgi:hypothetical protein
LGIGARQCREIESPNPPSRARTWTTHAAIVGGLGLLTLIIRVLDQPGVFLGGVIALLATLAFASYAGVSTIAVALIELKWPGRGARFHFGLPLLPVLAAMAFSVGPIWRDL